MPLIVGGGPAGSAAAIRLAECGLHPVLVERSAAPADVLCGGFLSWNTIDQLRCCGVDPRTLGAQTIRQARLFAGRRTVTIPLPAPAAGLSRQRLDEALIERAAQAGATIRRGVAVRSIKDGSVHYADGTSETPSHLILATGKHDVRGAPRPVRSRNLAMGLRWRFPATSRLARLLGDAIELHLFRHGYAGLLRQEGGAANLCLAVRHSAFADAGRDPQRMLALLLSDVPSLRDRLSGERMGNAQAIANIPYGWIARSRSDGLYRVGDQIGVIPSLVGEGVAIALVTGRAAADAIVSELSADNYQARISRRVTRPIATAAMLWHLAERPALAKLAFRPLACVPSLAAMMMNVTRVGRSTAIEDGIQD